MKSLSLLLAIFILPSLASAKGKVWQQNFKIEFDNKKMKHTYSLLEKKGKIPTYVLQWKDKGKIKRSQKIRDWQASQLLAKVRRLQWQSLYRNPASMDKCTPYIKVSTLKKVATICLEKKRLAGRSEALLYHLSHYFD
ncbi:MAG: hypothetical protein KDD33_10665 [Bdellovibrionales bacterium]|nr:hypothetical protein [Bdellovibrionales bacterium]